MENSLVRRGFNINFNLMVIGQVISILGAALLRFGLSLYVLDITGREDVFAALIAVSSIPLLLAPIGGAIADRFNKRNLMVIFDFTSCAVILCSIHFLAVGNPSVPLVGFIMFILATISSLYQPAVQSSIPVLVEERKLEQANGIVSGVAALSQFIAPVLGGVLYSVMGMRMLVTFSAAAFFLSAVMEIFIKIPFKKSAQDENIISVMMKDIKTGFSFVVAEPIIFKALILAALINLTLTPFFSIGGPIILRITMNSSDALYGTGMGLIQLFTIIGALTVGFFAKKMKLNKLYQLITAVAILMLPIALATSPVILRLGQLPAFVIFFIGVAPIVMALSIVSIYVITRVQRVTPNELLGKVMAIVMSGAQCAAPIGQFMYGILFRTFSGVIYVVALILCGVMFLMSALTNVMLRNAGE